MKLIIKTLSLKEGLFWKIKIYAYSETKEFYFERKHWSDAHKHLAIASWVVQQNLHLYIKWYW